MFRPTRDNAIVLGILTAMVIGASLFVYLPKNKELKNIRAEIETKKQELQASEEMVATIPVLARQVEEMRARYKGFELRLPKNQNLAQFLADIEEKLRENNLSTTDTFPGDPSTETRGSEILFHTSPINKTLKGTYLSFAKFLEDLEGMQRLTRIQKMRIMRDPEIGSDKVKIELLLNIYYTGPRDDEAPL